MEQSEQQKTSTIPDPTLKHIPNCKTQSPDSCTLDSSSQTLINLEKGNLSEINLKSEALKKSSVSIIENVAPAVKDKDDKIV